MNVIFVTHAFPRTVDDTAGSFILRLAVALRRRGISVRVLAPHAPGLAGQATLDGVAVRRFRYAPQQWETLAYAGTMAQQVSRSVSARLALAGLVGAASWQTRRERRVQPADIVHAHWWFPSGLAAAIGTAGTRTPLVVTMHGSDVRLAANWPGARRLFAFVARRALTMTAVSHWLATEASALAEGKLTPRVAPMPTDTTLFSPGGERSLNRLLYVGRLTRQKGIDMLLRAMPRLPAEVELDVVGDGPEAMDLRRLATSIGVASRVHWYAAVPQRELRRFYQTATALVVPSVDEGLGLVAVEALLCETPVVAFDSGGLRDVVADGETGVVARSIDADALGAAIRDLLDRPDRGASLGRTGRARALAAFDPDRVASRYATIYEEATRHRHT